MYVLCVVCPQNTHDFWYRSSRRSPQIWKKKNAVYQICMNEQWSLLFFFARALCRSPPHLSFASKLDGVYASVCVCAYMASSPFRPSIRIARYGVRVSTHSHSHTYTAKKNARVVFYTVHCVVVNIAHWKISCNNNIVHDPNVGVFRPGLRFGARVLVSL